jgi:hypothetical protein
LRVASTVDLMAFSKVAKTVVVLVVLMVAV